MAAREHPALKGPCGCSTPWVAGLGACCAKRLEMVADFNAELELTRKAESDATFGEATYGIVHSPPPVSIRREYIVLGDRSPPLEAPSSPGSRGSSRKIFKDERGADGILRRDMATYQLELQRLFEIKLMQERGVDDGDRPGFTSLYGTLPKEPAPQGDSPGSGAELELARASTTTASYAAAPSPARVRRARVPDGSLAFDAVRQGAPPEEVQQLRDAYLAAANGNAAPLEALRAAAVWSGEQATEVYTPSFASASAEKLRQSPVPRRSASEAALVSETRSADSASSPDPEVGVRTAVRRGVRHCRHVPIGQRRDVLNKRTSSTRANSIHQHCIWLVGLKRLTCCCLLTGTLDPIVKELEATQEEDRAVEHRASLLELQALALLEQAPSQPRPGAVVSWQPKVRRWVVPEPTLSPAFSPTVRARRSVRGTYPRLDLSGERRWNAERERGTRG